MFSNADQAAILRFIFDSDANVELALGVLAAGQSIRERIIQDFLKRLEAELGLKAKQLGDEWKVVNDLKTNPFKHWLQVYMTKQAWNDLYRISLEPRKMNAREFVLGVWNNRTTLGQRRDGGERIRCALKHVPSGETDAWWPFFMPAEPYQDWDDEKTLLDFRKQGGVQAVSFLAGAMFTIAQETESVINTVVQEWRDQPA